MINLLISLSIFFSAKVHALGSIQLCQEHASETGQTLDMDNLSHTPTGGSVLFKYCDSSGCIWTGSCSWSYDYVPVNPLGEKSHRNPINMCGSIVNVTDQAIGETVAVAGTNGFLAYRSDRTLSRSSDYTFTHQLTGDSVETGLGSMTVHVRVAGQVQTTQYAPPVPNLIYNFTWDGKDNLGNYVNTGVIPEIEVVHNWPFSSLPQFSYFHPGYQLGGFRAAALGLGEWTFSGVHFYDKNLKRIYFGTGETNDALALRVKDVSGALKVEESGPFDFYMVPQREGPLVYLFDQTGRHVQTRSSRTGALLETISYDSAGRLASIADAFGKTTSFTRPTSATVVIQAPYGQSTALTLNSAGKLIEVVHPIGPKHEMTYNSSGLLATFKNPRGAINSFAYSTGGLLESDTHSAGSSLTIASTNFHNHAGNSYRYGTVTSAMGRQTSNAQNLMETYTSHYQIAPSGEVIDHTYYVNAQVSSSVTPGRANSEYWAPDGRFGLAAPFTSYISTDSGGNSSITNIAKTELFDADDLLNLESETREASVDGKTWTQEYDGTTKIETITSPVGRVQTLTYDILGRVTTYKPYTYADISYGFDTSGRLSTVTQSGRTTEFTYNTAGQVSQIENPLSQNTLFTYDGNGRVLTQTLPDSRVLTFTYDGNGNVSSITTPASILHNLTYNLYDQMATYVAPVLGSTNYVTTYAYNDDKQLTSITRPDSSVVTFNYGATSALLDSIVAPEGTYTNTYNYHQLTQRVTPASVYTDITYLGDLVSTYKTTWGSVNGEVSYTYLNLLTDSVTVKDSSSATSVVAYTYDDDRLLATAGTMTNTRSAATGQLSGTALGNSTETFAYDATYGELDIYRHLYNGSQTYKEDYGRDLLGRITSRAVTIGSTTTNFAYVYDLGGRLKEVWTNGALTRTYNYTNNSNRSSMVQGATTTSATYDAQDRIQTYGNYSFTYNARGELSGRTQSGSIETFTYAYNSMGALTQVVRVWNNAGTTTTDTYTYLNDGFGRRVQIKKGNTVQKRFIYDERGRVIAELNTSGNLVSHFVYVNHDHVPDYMIRAGVKYKFIHDHVGSIVRVVNTTNGSVASSIAYDEFGRITTSATLTFQPFGFAGGLRDDITGWVRFGARDYDPLVGRWTAKDPIWFDGGDTNLYGYSFADPVNFLDPDGLTTGPRRFTNLPDAGGGNAGTRAPSINQIQNQIRSGSGEIPGGRNRPIRCDRDHGAGDRSVRDPAKDHIHFNDGSALNRDGSSHHGDPYANMTNQVRNWLRQIGWNVGE